MKKAVFAILLISFAAALALPSRAAAQSRRITPVTTPHGVNENNDTTKFDRARLKESVDTKGNIVLIDTVTGSEYVDTTAMRKVVGNLYPLLHAVTLGVNVWDGAMRAMGQHYGIGSLRGEISFHNRYKPFIEIGLGQADDTPDGKNFTFKSPPAPYFKLGFNYNIFYNSNPDYQLCAGVRYGLTNFAYSIDNVTVDGGYWDEPGSFAIPSQRVTAGYLELAAGVKVKIAGPISLGWEVVYHSRLHESRSPHGPAMIIPGYGKRDSNFTGAFFVYYTLSFKNKNAAEPPEPDGKNYTGGLDDDADDGIEL